MTMRHFPTLSARLSLFRWWLQGRPDKLACWVAYRLPRRLVYWGLIRAGAKVIEGHETVPEVTFTDVLQRWGQHSGMPGHAD
jgi:hypothetical protein